MTTIYLVRHAHADWNPDENRMLSDGGRIRAAVMCDLLSASPIDAIYSSPARRALETVEALANRLQLAPVTLADLRERELRVQEGMDFECRGQAGVARAIVGQCWN